MNSPCAEPAELPGELPSARPRIDEPAIRTIAKQCVRVIQGCLREEEWLDAEEEFARIIDDGLALMEKSRPSKLPD